MYEINRRQLLVTAGATLVASGAQAQAKRPEVIKILVPFAAGGTMDQIARLLAERLRGEIADTIVVDVKSGAAGRIAIDALRAAPGDGTTLMIHAVAIQTLYPHTFKNLGYDPFADLVALSTTNPIEFCFAVGPGVPASVTNLKTYIEWVKGDPKRAAFGTVGPGTPLHFLPMMLGKNDKVEMNPIHYRGPAAAIPDLLGGQLPALSAPLNDLLQYTGKVRILASSGAVRNKLALNVATYAEQGYPPLTSAETYAIYANSKTPVQVQEQYSAAIRKALATPAIATAFEKLYIEPKASTSAEVLKFARSDSERWAKIVKEVGYQPE
jgi:tripartite-type tricarboxylate transporter receptor subunit TctC